jgi:uncharacterized Tic20 family protein
MRREIMTGPNPYDVPPRSTPVQDLDFTPSSDERNYAVIAHLSGCAGVLGLGFVGFIGPLVIYLLKKDDSPFVEVQAKEAFNFQITILLIALVSGAIAAISCGALFFLIFVPMLLQVFYSIKAALAVRDGVQYRYPFNFRLLQ